MNKLQHTAIRSVKLFQTLGFAQAIKFLFARITGKESISVMLPGYRSPLWLRPSHTDINCLWQIFGGQDAKLPDYLDPKLIIDGGANVGYASVYYATRYPNATIVAVEPDDDNTKLLRMNLADYPQVKVVQGGVWSSTMPLKIANPDAASWSFTLTEAQEGDPVALHGYSVEDLMKMGNADRIDVLKLDIEGGETELFSNGFERWMGIVETIVIEIHGQEAHDTVYGAIENKGFNISNRGEKVLMTKASPDSAGQDKREPIPVASAG